MFPTEHGIEPRLLHLQPMLLQDFDRPLQHDELAKHIDWYLSVTVCKCIKLCFLCTSSCLFINPLISWILECVICVIFLSHLNTILLFFYWTEDEASGFELSLLVFYMYSHMKSNAWKGKLTWIQALALLLKCWLLLLHFQYADFCRTPYLGSSSIFFFI